MLKIRVLMLVNF